MNDLLKQKFASYPSPIKAKLEKIRALIHESAKDNYIENIEETLKWGEPSVLVKGGSTVRYDWKEKTPEHYFVYFNCKTKLVDTFKEVYSDLYKFDGNRAIVFSVDDPIYPEQFKHCILLALTYHKRKHLALLGA